VNELVGEVDFRVNINGNMVVVVDGVKETKKEK
jgi:hypothetical protein